MDLVLAFNKGISFGLLSDGQPWQYALIGMLVSLVGLVLILMYWNANTMFQSVCLGAIIGGALGNLSDRFIHGAVVDFIDFHLDALVIPFVTRIEDWHWPAFNVADSVIVSAVILLIFVGVFGGGRKPALKTKK
jgi:signal peptidase II